MKQRIKIVIIIMCMATAGICYSCDRKSTETKLVLEESIGEEAGLAEDNQTVTEPASPEETKPACYVHICGEVNSPGVYELEEGDRVFRVVELAGGFTPQAAADYLNMAETVSDGMKLVVPDVSALEENTSQYGTGNGAGDSAAGTAANQKVNINTASKEQLMTLTGIGQARAEDILRYREEKGRFQTIEDIMKVPGIKTAAFEKLKDDITV